MGRAVFTGRVSIGGQHLGKIDPLIIAQSRTTISLLVLAPILLLRNRSALRVRGTHLVQFFLLGIVGLAASNYFYYLAIDRTSVATAIVLQYVAPVWVLLYMLARRTAASHCPTHPGRGVGGGGLRVRRGRDCQLRAAFRGLACQECDSTRSE